eukprot:TRINITY_DN23185_c0_g1_i1.p2 TRINITY_DN23185_c0_g1~~TRINITY_DN23185_c0_g1_i1.p2  ORF type:complete len:144 (-),score=42.32 TRINITY_DN23185_c0_g1_i1:134-565(-)
MNKVVNGMIKKATAAEQRDTSSRIQQGTPENPDASQVSCTFVWCARFAEVIVRNPTSSEAQSLPELGAMFGHKSSPMAVSNMTEGTPNVTARLNPNSTIIPSHWNLYGCGESGSRSQWVVSTCLLYTSPSPRDRTRSRMPSSA